MKHSRGNTLTIRRVVKHASICLLLGAIVNVAVAWGFAWLFVPSDISWNGRLILYENEEWEGTSRAVWDEYFPSDMTQESYIFWQAWLGGDGVLRCDVPISQGNVSRQLLSLTLVQTGFPMNCLSYHYWSEHSERLRPLRHFESRFAWLWKQSSPVTISDRIIALPLRPLWPAFAINTIFYGVILWMLFIIPFVLRRWQRIRRGLCTKCAYDIRGDFESGCSECGWNREENVEMSKSQNEK